MIFNYGKYVVWSPSYMRILEIIKIQMLQNKNSRHNIFSFEMLTYFKILSVKHLEFEYFVLFMNELKGQDDLMEAIYFTIFNINSDRNEVIFSHTLLSRFIIRQF